MVTLTSHIGHYKRAQFSLMNNTSIRFSEAPFTMSLRSLAGTARSTTSRQAERLSLLVDQRSGVKRGPESRERMSLAWRILAMGNSLSFGLFLYPMNNISNEYLCNWSHNLYDIFYRWLLR